MGLLQDIDHCVVAHAALQWNACGWGSPAVPQTAPPPAAAAARTTPAAQRAAPATAADRPHALSPTASAAAACALGVRRACRWRWCCRWPAPAAPSLRAPQRRAAYRRRPAQATAAEAGGGPPVPSAAEAEAAAGTSGQAVGVAECGCWHQRCPSFGGATLVMGASSEETCGPRAGHMQASLGQHMRITVSHTDGRYRLAWRRTATWGVIGLVCTAPRERVAPQRKRSCRAAAMTAAAFSAPGANGALAPPLLTSCMPARADGRVEWRRGHRPGGSPRAAGREGREVDANGDAKQADCGAHLRNS